MDNQINTSVFRKRKSNQLPTNFQGVRVTALCRGGSEFVHLAHDRRDIYVVRGEQDHIYEDGYHETIKDSGSIQQAFLNIFEDARWEYNKGKRSDRQIQNYYEYIQRDARKGKHKNQLADGSRKHAYQFHFYLGNREYHTDDELTIKILKDFTTKYMPEHYPNFIITHNFLHGDEWSWNNDESEKIDSPIHSHTTGIFVAHCLTPEEMNIEKKRREKLKEQWMTEIEARGDKWDEKKWLRHNWQPDLVRIYGKALTSGMSLQCSMSAALAEMGFFTEKGKGTAQQQFEEAVRHDLQDFAESYGIKINRSLGRKHSHIEKDLYQKTQESERKLIQREINISNSEHINKMVRKLNRRRKEELDKREKNVVEMEAPLKARESYVSQKELQLNQKEYELDEKEEKLNTLNKSITEIQKAQDIRFNEIQKKENEYENKKKVIKSYEELANQIHLHNITLDSAVEELYREKTKTMSDRIKVFVNKCKGIVISLTNELHKYKTSFQSFWKASPTFFRQLAKEMESEKCLCFKDYELKRLSGNLSRQIAAREKQNQENRNKNEHIHKR